MTTTGLGGRADTFRALRAQAEASVLPLATSLDGRRFTFQSRIEGLELRLGGYVMLEGGGRTTLGQVRSLALAEADVGEVGLAGEGDADIRTQLRVRLARGEGVVLDGSVEPFHDHLARPATPEEIRTWLADVAPRRASLAVGGLSLAGGTPVRLDAGGFDRHTFLCGQSGSGKSYSLGLVLEQLLLETDLRIVILDPNSDCARLAELREDVPPDLADRWAALAPGIRVRSAESTGDERLRLRFGELAPATQAALLQLDPVGDREEYAELRALLVDSRPESHRRARGRGPPRGPPARAPARQPGPREPGRMGARRTRAPCSASSTIRRCAASSWTRGRWRPARSRRWSRRACSAASGSAAASGVRSSWSSTRRTTSVPQRRPTR